MSTTDVQQDEQQAETPRVITVQGETTGQPVDLDTVDLGVTEGETPVRPILEDLSLLWYNGLPTTDGKMAIGWHIKAGPNPYLDEACQALVAQGLAEQYLVQHKRPDKNGSNEPKLEWHLKQASLIVIADGALSPLQMNQSSERIGIAWNWGPEFESDGSPKMSKKKNEQSRNTNLKLRVFVHELYANGFYGWLPLTLHGYITDHLFESLYEQYRVLDAYAAYRRAKGLNPAATFYTFSLPTVARMQVRMVGDPPDQSAIYPIQAAVPATIDSNYLREHLIPLTLFQEIRDVLLPEAMIWSTEESYKIKAGKTDLAAIEGAGPHLMLPAGKDGDNAVDQADPLVTPAHVKWLTEHYCHNHAAVVQALCEKFGVTDLSQLRRSQYQGLVSQFQADTAAHTTAK